MTLGSLYYPKLKKYLGKVAEGCGLHNAVFLSQQALKSMVIERVDRDVRKKFGQI